MTHCFLLLLRLVRHLVDLGTNGGLIAKIMATKRSNGIRVRNDVSLLIKIVNERASSGNVQSGDVLLADLVQIHDQGTERVSVSRDDQTLSLQHTREDLLLPIGKESLSGRLQGLGRGQLVLRNVSIATIVSRVVLRIRRHGWGRNIIATSPDHDLDQD